MNAEISIFECELLKNVQKLILNKMDCWGNLIFFWLGLNVYRIVVGGKG